MVELRLEGVTKHFAETRAVEDLSVTVADGEFFTLVGPSGCGKTTTLRLVAGLERPDTGSVSLDGETVAGERWRPPEERDIGVVFQSYALFPHMSVAENVAYGLRFRAPPEGTREERVAELLDLVDMAGMGDRDPAALSGGQRQRVALARALAPSPGLLLLDEPMSALDARLRESLRREVRSIQQELDITTLYVTHDQKEAMATSDRIGVLSAGRLEGVGEPRALYRRPPSRFVASFLGENNLFEGRVVGVESAGADGTGADTAAGEETARRVTVDAGSSRFTVTRGGATGDGETSADVSVGDRVTVCVRPEALSPTESRNAMQVAVEGTEFLGSAVRVWGEWADRRVVCRLAESPGETLRVGFAPGAAHLITE
jgi:ABC-type spermidine/putrescine transport systems, ATPase components